MWGDKIVNIMRFKKNPSSSSGRSSLAWLKGTPHEPEGVSVELPTIRRTLEIGGMTSPACVNSVATALNRVSGIRTESVVIGQAVIGCTYPAAFGMALGAVFSAGFTAKEAKGSGGEGAATT